MKLEHPKSWYQKNSEIEGDSEIGAGIPPWTRAETRKSQQVSTVPTVTVARVLARKTSEVPRERNITHRTPKVCCPA
jgi:hypothetical protein